MAKKPKKSAKSKATANAATGVAGFGTAFRYPFARPKGLLNGLWLLLPIIGWLALIGYSIRIVKEFIKGKFERLPLFDFYNDLKFGFVMLLKMLPLIIALIAASSVLQLLGPIGSLAAVLMDIFIAPILFINFFSKGTIESSFEFGKLRYVFDNIGEYITAILKSIALSIVFFVMIIVLVGIPASMFTKNIFLADFYRRFAR